MSRFPESRRARDGGNASRWDVKTLLRRLNDFLQQEDDPDQPYYDPVHVGGVVIVTFFAVGCLYWLLWTLLVYEGGIFLTLKAIAQLLFTSKTPRDLGFEGYPYAMGAFEGAVGNLSALASCIALLWVMRRLYVRASRRRR